MHSFRAAPAAALTAAVVAVTAGVITTPAQAAATAPTGPVVVQNCAKTLGGVPLRIKMRFELRSAGDPNDVRRVRVRVSHPDGTGNFAERRVRTTATTFFFESQSVNDQIGSAAWVERKGGKPSYRQALGDTDTFRVVTRFKLRNGTRAVLSCTHWFPKG